MAGLFGSGMPFGMFGGGRGLLSGAPEEINWGHKIGALLQDLGANYDGRQGYALPMLAHQQQRLGDQKKYQDTLAQLSAPPAPVGAPQVDENGAAIPQASTPAGPLFGAQYAQMLPLLQNMDPDKGLPLIFNAMQGEQQFARQEAARQQERADLARRPATAEEKAKYGLDPMTPAEIDGRGNITPISDPRAITPYQNAQLGLSRDQLNATIRGQNMTDARAREASGRQGLSPGYRWRADGVSQEPIPGGPADSTGKNSKATDTQRVTALYADRAREAENVLSGSGQPGSQGYNPGVQGQGTSLAQNVRSRIPGVGNYLVSDDFQKYDQAKRNFVNAILRKESGAVISDQEFGNAEKQYFPQPGDTPQVIAQKRANRETAIEGLRRAAGTAMNDNGVNRQNSAAIDTGAQETKSIGGKSYVKINGQWYEQ